MDDVRGLFLGMPHGTTPAAVTTNKKIKFQNLHMFSDIFIHSNAMLAVQRPFYLSLTGRALQMRI